MKLVKMLQEPTECYYCPECQFNYPDTGPTMPVRDGESYRVCEECWIIYTNVLDWKAW